MLKASTRTITKSSRIPSSSPIGRRFFMDQAQKMELLKYSTCEISDCLIPLGIVNGGYVPDITMKSPPVWKTPGRRIAGPAFTCQMVEFTDTESPKPKNHFVDECPSGSILVISTPAHVRSACWGGLMSTAAKAQGIEGVVIDGRCRDIVEHWDSDFPVFASGQSTLGQSPFTRPSVLGGPLTIPSSSFSSTLPPVTVSSTTDIVLADIEGVVIFPSALMKDILELAEKKRKVDDGTKSDLEKGVGVKEAFKKWRG